MCPHGENAALTEQNVFFAGCQQRHLRDALTGRDNNNEEKRRRRRRRRRRSRKTEGHDQFNPRCVRDETLPHRREVRRHAPAQSFTFLSCSVQFSSVCSVPFLFCCVPSQSLDVRFWSVVLLFVQALRVRRSSRVNPR